MRYLILLALLAVAACGAPPRQWGDNPEAYAELARDNVAAQCQHDYPEPLRQACERQGLWEHGLTHEGGANLATVWATQELGRLITGAPPSFVLAPVVIVP